MKAIKWVLFGVSLVFCGYVGLQSYIIASMGASYQVAQLEGDGGAGLLFAGLCLSASCLVWARFWVSTCVWSLAAILDLGIGLYYQDTVTILWAAGPLVFAGTSIVLRVTARRRRRATSRHPLSSQKKRVLS